MEQVHMKMQKYFDKKKICIHVAEKNNMSCLRTKYSSNNLK